MVILKSKYADLLVSRMVRPALFPCPNEWKAGCNTSKSRWCNPRPPLYQLVIESDRVRQSLLPCMIAFFRPEQSAQSDHSGDGEMTWWNHNVLYSCLIEKPKAIFFSKIEIVRGQRFSEWIIRLWSIFGWSSDLLCKTHYLVYFSSEIQSWM